ncbi:MAG TPA: citryl-CoA lyase [Alphaproteobacteria bacterium]|nr:citryl-CoA lyase [Alphaproteobacteria bacterium]
MWKGPKPTTAICTSTPDSITVRGHDLVEDLVGQTSFTEMMFLCVMGRRPSTAETAIVDAVMVILMGHGLTPSALATRLVYASSPEAMQAGIAAGLLAVGNNFVGTMEGAARLLEEMVADDAGIEAAARRLAEEHRAAKKPLPGFGHPIHRPDDPRTPKLLAVAEGHGVPGKHIAALRNLGAAVDEVYGRHITINATGAIGAVLCEIGVPAKIMRGFAVVTRAAGLVGHIREEQETPAGIYLCGEAEHLIPYEGEGAS